MRDFKAWLAAAMGSTAAPEPSTAHGSKHDAVKQAGIAHTCDDPDCFGYESNVIREFSKHAAAFLLGADEPDGMTIDNRDDDTSWDVALSREQVDMLRSIVGRELKLAGLERMAIVQHKHHLRHIRGLTTDAAIERLAFYDDLIHKLQRLRYRIDMARRR